MNKKDCEVGMFVSVIQNLSSLARNRSTIKRIGKVVGIYDRFVNLLLFDFYWEDLDNIIIGRELYKESFRYSEISEINGVIISEIDSEFNAEGEHYEEWKSYVFVSVS